MKRLMAKLGLMTLKAFVVIPVSGLVVYLIVTGFEKVMGR